MKLIKHPESCLETFRIEKTQLKPTQKYMFGSSPSTWQSTYWIFFGHAGLGLGPDPTETRSDTQSMRNILCILGIFGYFGYIFGITYILLTFRFGFSIIVKISKL